MPFTAMVQAIVDFWAGFNLWLNSLTLLQLILLMLVPLVIDFTRSVGKSCFLLLHSLHRKIHPIKFDPWVKPMVSIIIPAHNEENSIEKSVESCIEMDYPLKEIIVVDDGSTDATYDKALPYEKRGLIKLLHRDTAGGSKAVAVNYGISFSKGKLIVILDADTLFERRSLSEAIKYFSDPLVNAVSGNVRVMGDERGGRNLLVRLQSYEYLLSLEMGRRYNAIMGTLIIIPGAFGIIRRAVGSGLGFFDRDTVTEDFDMTVKLRKVKGRVLFASEAISWTSAPGTWRKWINQRIRWTHGQLATLWKHRDAFKKQRFSLPFVTALYDMIFMDLVMLFIKFSWIGVLFYLYWPNILALIYLSILSFTFYLSSELFTGLTAGILSPRKSDLKHLYLLPLIILFYRPFYGLIRLKAYVDFFLKRQVRW